MARKPFPKSTTRQTVSINVREVPKHLHLFMRQEALAQECSLGRLYGEALAAFYEQKTRMRKDD